MADPANGKAAMQGTFHKVNVPGLRPPASDGQLVEAPMVRASVSAATFDTWWSPNAMCMSTVWAGVPGSGIGGDVVGVAVGLGAVPLELDGHQPEQP